MQKRLIGILPLLMILAASILCWIVQPPQYEQPFARAADDATDATQDNVVLSPGTVLYIPGEAQREAKLVHGGEPLEGRKRIALTFDSGWIAEHTPALLDILRKEGVPATFFHRGKWAEANPELVRQIVADAHLIGNHSYTHPYMDKLLPEELVAEIEQAHHVLEELIGYSPWLYRPPYGSCTPAIRQTLSELGYTHSIMWSIDTHDWKDPGVNYIVRRVLDNARDGAIVLMHVGAGQAVDALPQIIAGLRSAGFEFVLVDELLPLRASATGLMPYRVRAGDTWESVAFTYSIEVKELIAFNPTISRTP